MSRPNRGPGDIDAWLVCLDTTDTVEIIMIVKASAAVYGEINLEDIAAPRCFEVERRLLAPWSTRCGSWARRGLW